MLCPYCNRSAQCVSGDVIYPHRPDLAHKWFWQCKPCGAYCGCHGMTQKPLGTLADAALRKARSMAHDAFDPIWKLGQRKRLFTRTQAYAWLAGKLGVDQEHCHIGMFDLRQCSMVREACRNWEVREIREHKKYDEQLREAIEGYPFDF